MLAAMEMHEPIRPEPVFPAVVRVATLVRRSTALAAVTCAAAAAIALL